MKRLNILDFGADKTGKSVNTAAIQRAVNECPVNGCVYVPKGIYISGALFFKSDMTLFLDDGAVIKGSGNTDDFPVKTYRWEGRETECYSSLINAGIGGDGVCNFTIEGEGTIDANGSELFFK